LVVLLSPIRDLILRPLLPNVSQLTDDSRDHTLYTTMNVAKRRSYNSYTRRPKAAKRNRWAAKPRTRPITIRDQADVASYRSTKGNYLRMSRVVPGNTMGILSASATATQQAVAWTLSDIGGLSDFNNLFDSYKITSVTCTWSPHPGNTANSPGMIWCAADFNDGTAPASLEAIKQYDNVRYGSIGQKRILTIYPQCGLKADGPAADPGYTYARSNPWIAISDNQVPFYGLKVGYERNDSSTNAINYGQWTFKINFLLRNRF